MVYVVTSLREYENDELYFGCDGVFASREAAKDYVKKDMNETVMQCTAPLFEMDDDYCIHDGNDLYRWQIEGCEIHQ